MRLSIVNIYRHVEVTTPVRRVPPAPLRAALIDDLTRMVALAKDLRYLAGRPQPGGRWAAEYEEFLGLLGPAAPRCIRLLEEGWFRIFEDCARRDRELLQAATRGSAGAASSPPAWSVERGQPLFAAVGLAQNGSPGRALEHRRLAHYETIDRAGGGTGTRAVALYLEDYLSRRLPERCRLCGVEVTEHQFARGAETQVSGWAWSACRDDSQPTDAGLAIQIDVPAHAATSNGLRAVVRLRVVSPTPRLGRRRGLRRALQPLWKHLTADESATSPISTLAAVLRDAASRARQRDWEEVFGELVGPVRDGQACDSRLLAEMAVHAKRLDELTREHREALLEILPGLLRSAAWTDVRRWSLDVIVPLARGTVADCRMLYSLIADALPAEPSDDDLDFMLKAAGRLGVDLGPGGAVVPALRQFGRERFLDGGVRSHLRGLLCVESGGGSRGSHQSILEFFQKCVHRAPLSHLPELLESFAAPLAAILRAGSDRAEVEAFLRWTVCGPLADESPRTAPGVWLTADQLKEFLRAIEAFVKLISHLEIASWDLAKHESLRTELPRVLDNKAPARYPSSYWQLLRCWLLQQHPDGRMLRSFHREMAVCIVRLEPQDPPLPWSVPLDMPDGRLSGLGHWLQKQSADERVYRAIADTILDAVADGEITVPLATATVFAISGMVPSTGLQSIVSQLLSLSPWPEQADQEFRRWLSDLMRGGGSTTSGRLCRVALRAMMQDAPRCEAWVAMLQQLPSATEADSKAALAELQGAIAAGADLALCERGLSLLASRGEVPAAAADCYQRWEAQIRQWKDKNILAIDQSLRLLLLSSCLRDDTCATRSYIQRLWPDVPATLLLRGDGAGFSRFIACCREVPDALTPAQAHVLAGQLDRGLARQDDASAAIRVLSEWSCCLNGELGPEPLIRQLWTWLPGRLILKGAHQQLQELSQMDAIGKLPDSMWQNLAGEVLEQLESCEAPTREEQIACWLSSLAIVWHNKWAKCRCNLLGEMADSGRWKSDILLPLARALLCTRSPAVEREFNDQLWMQAHRLQAREPSLARGLIDLLT